MSWLRSLRLCPGDFVIVLIVVVLAVGISLPFLRNDADTMYVEIYEDDALVKRVLLADGYQETVTIEGAVTNVIDIDGKSVRFSESTCPDQVCVRTGTLTRVGQTAVCLPNRVIVRLTGQNAEIDAIVGGAG